MINKKNLLGKTPEILGDKDAIHVAIVAVRAARGMAPGQKFIMNADREAQPLHRGGKYHGVVDPFRATNVARGEVFWGLLSQTEVPNVQHHWDHPTVDFSPPVVEVEKNRTIQSYADDFGVTYEQVMQAARYVVDNDRQMPYPADGKYAGNLEELLERFENDEIDSYDFWGEWSEETCTEFPNEGTECCPEYCYPERCIFDIG